MAAAREGALVSFGVVPDSPSNGYGYLRSGSELAEGVHQLEEFVEKPDLETARSYLDQGSYLWNSGMFLFSARSYLDELERLQPDMLASCRQALAEAGRDLDFVPWVKRPLPPAPPTPSIMRSWSILARAWSYLWTAAGAMSAPGRRCGRWAIEMPGTTSPSATWCWRRCRGAMCGRTPGWWPRWGTGIWRWGRPRMQCWWRIGSGCRKSAPSSTGCAGNSATRSPLTPGSTGPGGPTSR